MTNWRWLGNVGTWGRECECEFWLCDIDGEIGRLRERDAGKEGLWVEAEWIRVGKVGLGVIY